MTLSAADPWQTVLARRAPQWAAEVRAEHPQLSDITLVVTGGTVTVAALPKGLPAATSWLLANTVAGWWPGWLAPLQVGCVIRCGTLCARADPTLMCDVAAGGMDRVGWICRASMTIG